MNVYDRKVSYYIQALLIADSIYFSIHNFTLMLRSCPQFL